VPQRVAEILRDSKFIVLLRNPIDRAYSHYQHSVTHGFESLSFEEAIDQEGQRLESELEQITETGGIADYNTSVYLQHSYISRGIYIEQIRRWMNVVPPDRFLILKYEDFFGGPPSGMSRVFDFLGLSDMSVKQFPVRNVGAYTTSIRDDTRTYLRSVFRPHNDQLAQYLGMDFADWI
jgi:hypothetical protein